MEDAERATWLQVSRVSEWLDRCASDEQIPEKGVVALQLEDELLSHSFFLTQELKKRTKANHSFVVTADTTLSPCCIDAASAERAGAVAIVHFGHACLTPCSWKKPLFFVHPQKTLSIAEAAESMVENCGPEGKLVVLLPQHHASAAAALYQAVVSAKQARGCSTESCENSSCILVPKVDRNYRSWGVWGLDEGSADLLVNDKSGGADEELGGVPASPFVEDSTVVYVGDDCAQLVMSLLLLGGTCSVLRWDDPTKCLVRADASALLRRRYYLVQRAKDAVRVGVVAQAVTASSTLPALRYAQDLLRKSGRHPYSICVGRLNPAKLANFSELECFVALTCAEGIITDTKEYYAPVITLWELVIALVPGVDWDGRVVTDVEYALHEGSSAKSTTGKDDEDDDTHFSFVKGGLVHVATNNVQSRELVAVPEGSAAAALMQRQFQGLSHEDSTEDDCPLPIVQGRSGVAAGYSHEAS